MVYDLKVNLMFMYKYYLGHEITITLWTQTASCYGLNVI